jgi:hypothetical protein
MSQSIYRVILKAADKLWVLFPHTKIRKTSISTSVREHSICELYSHKCSKCPCSWLVDPHVLLLRLSGNHYHDFQSHDLLKLQEVVPLAVTVRMWRMMALWYVRSAMRGVLCSSHHGRWTGTLHARSESFGFCPVGAPKASCTVCSPCWQRRGISPRTVYACQTVQNCPAMCERMRQSMKGRVACIECHGGIFRALVMNG